LIPPGLNCQGNNHNQNNLCTFDSQNNHLKKLYLFFFVLITFESSAQTSVYHPFPDSNVVWNVEVSTPCSVGFNDRFWTSYIIEGDTVIGLNNYRKVYKAWIIEYWQCWGMNFSGPGYYVGAIRQDTAARTVYYYESGSTSERLLYDFNLHAGDTLRGFLAQCPDDSVIAEEDSVLINGNFRKRWKLNLWYGPNYIIEGIGFTGGPLSPICGWFEGGPTLICCTQDNVVLFEDSLYTTTPGLCDLIDLVYPVEKNSAPLLYPNPVNDEVVLETIEAPATLRIFNSMGCEVVEQKILSTKTILNLKDLPKGIYFYTLNNSSLLLSTGNFIKD